MALEATEQRRLAAIMFTDMVGYSALSQRDEILALELLEEHRRLLREIFPRFHGTEIKTMGDAFLVEFGSALEAAQCAIEIQRTLAKRNADIAPDRRIEVKIGVHIGDVVHRGGDVYGDGVNIASRIEPVAGPGGICVSMDVERQIRNALQARLEKLESTELKNISVPMDLFRIVLPWEHKSAVTGQQSLVTKNRKLAPVVITIAVIAAALLAWHWLRGHERVQGVGGAVSVPTNQNGKLTAHPTNQGSAVAIPEKSIAVLPFENLSSDKENAYFAEGIQDEILTRLSKIADLKVISRTSTQHYKSAPENLPEIARQLGVAHLVEGSVQKSGDAVRVNVQLIKAANDSHLWADTFDRKLTDIFSVETEVAKAIADQLRVKLTGQEQAVIAAKPTENPEAYDAYLRGLAYSLKSNPTQYNIAGAQEHLREAIRLDPKFALAWSLLASVDALAHSTFHVPTCEESLQAADTAFILHPTLGEALMAKGYYYYGCLRDYESARTYFQRAHEVLPNSSQIPQALAFVMRRAGDLNASLDYFEQSQKLDPRNTALLTQYALTYTVLRRFDDASHKLDEILTILPGDVDTVAVKACVLISQGNVNAASAAVGSLHPSSDRFFPLEVQAYVAILSRQTGPIVSQLSEALVHSDPARRQENAELRFWFGWAQSMAGEAAAAKTTWQQTRAELEDLLKQQPENLTVIADLALTCIGLEDAAAAEALADRASVLDVVKRDALLNPFFREMRARAAARAGDADQAIPLLTQLLSTPYAGVSYWDWRLTPALLRLDPMFDPLRNDPRFQKLCEEKR